MAPARSAAARIAFVSTTGAARAHGSAVTCGAGDGVELAKRFLGLEFRDAARAIEQHIGAAPVTFRTQQRTNEQTLGEMRDMWKRSRSIASEDAVGLYLRKRLGLTSFPPGLRFCPDERYAELGSRPSWHPTMLALVEPSDAAKANGEKPALHRTYLDGVGGKADVSTPRKMIGSMPSGAAVRLAAVPGNKLGIAEGIETALAASILFNMPVWAALTAGLLQEWSPPASVSTVFIFADNDASSTGQAAGYTLAQKLKARGTSAFVELPPVTGTGLGRCSRTTTSKQSRIATNFCERRWTNQLISLTFVLTTAL